MFRKRTKKTYPPGTFIPTPARVFAIIQLCLAFTVILWNASQPFAGEFFALKSRLLLYEDAMGVASASAEQKDRLLRNKERFQALPDSHQQQLKAEAAALQRALGRSFWSKLADAADFFLFKIPLYERAWLILSVILPILLLKRVEGASLAVWLLPCVAACYAIDSTLYGLPGAPSLEQRLFPSEQTLVETHIGGPLSDSLLEQQKQLASGWKHYLVLNWANTQPSSDPAVFEIQAEEGAFAFTLARLGAQSLEIPANRNPRQPLLFLLIYFVWNTLFAYAAWKHAKFPC